MKAFAIFMLFILLAACSSNEAGNTNSGEQKDSSSGDKVSSQGVTDSEILIGHIGPQTGPVAEYDKVRKGIQAYFNYVNDNGGVNGRTLKLVPYDDQYQPAQTVQAAKRLINTDKVFAIHIPIGTANISAALSDIQSSGIPVTALSTGADKFVNPPIKNIFGGQFNYPIEAKIFLDYVATQMGAKNIAIASQNDDFGKQGLEAIRDNVGNYEGLKIIKEVTFLATDKEFSSQAQQLKQANPDVIIMISTPAPAASLRKEMHKINATNIPYIVSATGGMDKNQFNLAGEEVWEGSISAHVIENHEISTHPENEKYIEYVTKEYGEENLGSLSQYAWAQSQVLVEALKRSGDDLTWDNFIAQMESFDKWDGSFYPSITYTPEHRYGTTSIFLVQAKDGDLEPITGYIHYNVETGEIEYQ